LLAERRPVKVATARRQQAVARLAWRRFS